MRASRLVVSVAVLVAGLLSAVAPASATPGFGNVVGTVTAEDGSPVAGVRVLVADRSDVAHPVASTVTDATGGYRLDHITSFSFYVLCFDASGVTPSPPEGYLSVCGYAPWGGDEYPQGTSLYVPDNGTTTEDRALTPAAGITGQVTTADGAPLAGVVVRVGHYSFQGHTTTAADGSYHLRGVIPSNETGVCFDADAATGGSSPGGYLSQCHAGMAWVPPSTQYPPNTITLFPVQAGVARAGIDAVLVPGGELTGTVRADAGGAPIGGVEVTVQRPRGPSRTVVTATDGSYRITGLTTHGDYLLCFDASSAVDRAYQSECWRDAPWDPRHDFTASAAGSTPVAVTEGDVGEFDVGLASSGRVAGTVLSASGAPLAGVTAVVYRDGQWYEAGTTDAAGHYVVAGLAALPSPYTVCFVADAGPGRPGGFRSECHQDQYLDFGSPPTPTATSVLVRPGGRTPVDARLERGVEFTGAVTTAEGGISGVTVLLFDAAGAVLATRTTGSGGRYDFRGLPPRGGYRVCALAVGFTSAPGFVSRCNGPTPWSGALSAPTGDVLPAVAGHATTVDLPVTRAGSVGVVTGARAGDFQIVVIDSSGHRVGRGQSYHATRRTQTYAVSGLDPAFGPYRVCVASTDAASTGVGVAPRCYDGVSGSASDWDGGDVDALDFTGVPVTVGQQVAVNLGPLADGAALTGVVSETAGPLGSARVTVFASTGTAVRTVTTAADGSYRVVGLNAAAGPYRVCATAAGHRGTCWRSAAWSGTGGPPAAALAVALTAGKVVGHIDPELPLR